MKKSVLTIIMFLFILIAAPVYAANPISKDGYYKGIRLCGRVKVVNNFPDIKVKVVSNFANLNVKQVKYSPSKIGEWKFVEYGQDFKIKFVDNFPDITISFVDAFPCVRR